MATESEAVEDAEGPRLSILLSQAASCKSSIYLIDNERAVKCLIAQLVITIDLR